MDLASSFIYSLKTRPHSFFRLLTADHDFSDSMSDRESSLNRVRVKTRFISAEQLLQISIETLSDHQLVSEIHQVVMFHTQSVGLSDVLGATTLL